MNNKGFLGIALLGGAYYIYAKGKQDEGEVTDGQSSGASAPVFSDSQPDTIINFPDVTLPSLTSARSSGQITSDEESFLKKAVVTNRLLASQSIGGRPISTQPFSRGEILIDRERGTILGGTDLVRGQSLSADSASLELGIETFSSLSKKDRNTRLQSEQKSLQTQQNIQNSLARSSRELASDKQFRDSERARVQAQELNAGITTTQRTINALILSGKQKKEEKINFTPANFSPLQR